MKVRKVCNIICIIGFLLLILLPLIFINRDPDAVSFLENKKLVSRPLLINNNELNKNYINEMDQYIDENIGFKQKMIECNLAFMYQLFGKLDIKNYIMADNGHLFYGNNGSGVEIWQGKIEFSEEQKGTFTEKLENCMESLAEKECKFYLMGIPDKENVYPEFYPKTIIRYDDETRVDNLLEYVRQHSDVPVIPMKEGLLKAKSTSDNILYSKTYDITHWNHKGAWMGYKIMLDYIKQSMPNIKRLNENDIEFVEEKTSTINFLEKSDMLKKIIYLPDSKWNIKFRVQNGTRVDLEEDELFEEKDGDIYFHYKNNNALNKGKIMIIGDSYIYNFLLPLLSETFQDVYFIQSSDKDQKQKLFMICNPDIIVYEFVERAFYYDYSLEVFDTIKKAAGEK